MNRRFEDIWDDAPDDEPAGPGLDEAEEETESLLGETGDETESLLDAWYRERSQRIETALVLDEARRLLRKLVATRELDDAPARQARKLLRAIRDLKDNLP